jgi:hypothetical protein
LKVARVIEEILKLLNHFKATTDAPDNAEPTEEPPAPEEAAGAEASCDTPPSKAMKQFCCLTPHGYYVTAWLQCFRSTGGGGKEIEKVTQCYNNEIKIVQGGKVNKVLVKRLYNLIHTAYTKKWEEHINTAVDKCEYEEKANLTEGIAGFYGCINEHLADNCVALIGSPDCEHVAEYFDDCKDQSCKSWPAGMPQADNCCKRPIIFGVEFSAECRLNCSLQLFTDTEINKCVSACTNETDLFTPDDVYDKEKVKELLRNSKKGSDTWDKVIDEGIDECEMSAKGSSLLFILFCFAEI